MRTPVNLAPFIAAGVKSAVDHAKAAVRAQLVVGRNAAQTAFEAVIEPGDLVPLARVACGLEVLNRREALRQVDAAAQRRTDQQR